MNRKMLAATSLLALILPSAADLGGYAASLRAADYYVATSGSDMEGGTASQPFQTIQKGIDAASKPGDTVTVLSGTYREQLSVGWHGTPEKPIVLQSAQRQKVILDGAERVCGWRLLDDKHNVWGKEFATQAPYNNDHGRWDLEPRSEQVFVDGKRCIHVKDDTAYEAMPDYSFTATLSDPARYVLRLPHGVHPDTAKTEVTVESSLLNVRANNVVIDGFIFRRVRNTYQKSMVTLHGEAIEFRNNLLEYSSAGTGLGIAARHSHIHDNVLRANGQYGFSLGGSENIIEDNLVAGNDLAGYKEWATGGTKIVGNANIIRRNRFLDNLGGVAIWLDCWPCNNIIQYNYVSGNYGEGIRAEICFHNYIGYNIVENTRPCTSTMFGRTQTHCIGISVQNSAETCVVNNFLKDNRGAGIQLSTYNRRAADAGEWRRYRYDQRQEQWLRQSADSKVVYAYNNLFFNNVILQSTAEATGPCVYLMGLLNNDKPHCFGNQFDYNFYCNSLTHAPKVQIKNLLEVPDGTSQWQTHYGMDAHALGGFSPEDYRQPAFDAEYPYNPTSAFAGIGKGKDLNGLPWHAEADYLGSRLPTNGKPGMGHIENVGR
jgi:hypothetical protein